MRTVLGEDGFDTLTRSFAPIGQRHPHNEMTLTSRFLVAIYVLSFFAEHVTYSLQPGPALI